MSLIERLPESYELVEELSDRYIVTNKEGKRLVLYKIDSDATQTKHNEEIKKAAKFLNREEVTHLFHKVKTLQKNPPTVVDYYDLAAEIAKTLQNFYNQIGSPNIFHQPVKNIDPEIYGKAQSFMRQLEILKNILKEIILVEK